MAPARGWPAAAHFSRTALPRVDITTINQKPRGLKPAHVPCEARNTGQGREGGIMARWRNRGGGGQQPPRQLQLEVYELRWTSAPEREILFGVRVKEGVALKPGVPVRFKIDGRDEGVVVVSGPDGVAYHKYDGLDPARDIVTVAAFTVNPATEVSTVIDFTRQAAGRVATIDDLVPTLEPTAEDSQEIVFQGFRLEGAERRRIPASGGIVTVLWKGRSAEVVLDQNGRGRIVIPTPGKGLWVTIQGGGITKRLYLCGARARGVLVSAPVGPRLDNNQPWFARFIDAWREFSNAGFRRDPGTAPTTAEVFTVTTERLPEWVRNIIRGTSIYHGLGFGGVLTVLIFSPFTWLLGWWGTALVVGVMITAVMAFLPYGPLSIARAGRLFTGTDNARWLTVVLLVFLLMGKSYYAPWGESLFDRAVISTQAALGKKTTAMSSAERNERMNNALRFKGWVLNEDLGESPSPALQAEHAKPKPEIPTRHPKAKKERPKGWYLWWAGLLSLWLFVWAWPTFSDDISVRWAQRQHGKEHEARRERARAAGQPEPPQPESPYSHLQTGAVWGGLVLLVDHFIDRFLRGFSWFTGKKKD